jgi:hypothetical protein
MPLKEMLSLRRLKKPPVSNKPSSLFTPRGQIESIKVLEGDEFVIVKLVVNYERLQGPAGQDCQGIQIGRQNLILNGNKY